MKKITTTILSLCAVVTMMAQGWPANYSGVMLQGFYWDSFADSKWTNLEAQADEISQSFDLLWLPQSGNCNGTSMGYDDYYWFPGGNHYTSTFGTEEQLRSLITTLKSKGVGTIADVVINHRKNKSNWVDFPEETYKGETYTMVSTDICRNDDGGATKEWADKNSYSLSNYNDTGEDWPGMRDLDHNSANVQTIVKAYLKMLLSDLGYAGFRYDMVKGYAGKFTGAYNADSKPTYSVGEYWDGNTNTVKNWINATKVDGAIQSAAFDFPFRYTVRNALRGSTDDKNTNNWKQEPNWSLLGNTSLAADASYRRYSVTFIENHDTEKRKNDNQDPIKCDTLAGNAYLLAMPGTPCVFFKHWIDHKSYIKHMISARKLAGINNQSVPTRLKSSKEVYAVEVAGTKGKLVAVLGSGSYTPDAASYALYAEGKNFKYYIEKKFNEAVASLGSGTYYGEQTVTLSSLSSNSSAKVVYTTDGTAPTASSKQVNSGATIKIPLGTTTLKVALLIGSNVSAIKSYDYEILEPQSSEFTIPSFCTISEGEVCAFYEAPAGWADNIYCWAWNDTPAENFTSASGTWPGISIGNPIGTRNGNKVYKWTWDGTRQNNTTVAQPSGIIFSVNGSPQTEDLQFVNGGYYTEDSDVTKAPVGVVTGIKTPIADLTATGNNSYYTLSGQKVATPTQKGIYIHKGKKIIIK